MATATVDTAPSVQAETEQCLVVHGVGWSQYETIVGALPERANVRVSFVDGRMTLLSPTRGHVWTGKRLGHLVIAVASGVDMLWEDSGHATYCMKGKNTGVEGDETFYFGAHAEIMRGSVEIDLASQPPPDLVIEVELTYPADDALIVWGRLGAPEVWRFDVRRWTFVFAVRQADGSNAPSVRSLAFPVLEPNDVLAQLRLAEELGSSRWHRKLDAWVRDVLLPRRVG